MVKLNKLMVSSPPLVDSANGETEITLSYKVRITQPGDNPVKVELKISPSKNIVFVSTQNTEEDEVEWEQNFEVGVNKDYSETVVVKVKQPQDPAQISLIKMTLTSALGLTPSSGEARFQYK
jgi:hypothetical protein